LKRRRGEYRGSDPSSTGSAQRKLPPRRISSPFVNVPGIRWTATVKRALAHLGIAEPGPTRFPQPFRPMLAEPGKTPFDSPEWIYEPKWDGIRIVAHIRPDRVRLLSRNLQNFTGVFAPVTDSLKSLTVPAVLDGEVVAVGPDGLPDFAALQQWLRSETQPRTGSLSYVVFDCLYVNGHNLKERPLKERQDILAALKPALNSDFVRVTDPFPGALGTFVYEECRRQGLEGVVAKRLASKYQPGKRSKDWRKMAFRTREEFVVAGYLSSAPSRLSTLILGQYDGKRALVYAGLVGSGLATEIRRVIFEELKATGTKTCPFALVPTLRSHWGGVRTDLSPHWVKPTLVVEVEYRERLEDGLRHAALKSLRPDRDPKQVALSAHRRAR